VRCDGALRLVERTFEDGTQLQCRYGRDGTDTIVALPSGERYLIATSQDARRRSLRLPQGGQFTAAYDAGGCVVEVRRGKDLVVANEWTNDRRLAVQRTESAVIHHAHDEYGRVRRTLLTAPETGPSYSRWLSVEDDDSGRQQKITDYTGNEIRHL
jgi:hypothetical protein